MRNFVKQPVSFSKSWEVSSNWPQSSASFGPMSTKSFPSSSGSTLPKYWNLCWPWVATKQKILFPPMLPTWSNSSTFTLANISKWWHPPKPKSTCRNSRKNRRRRKSWKRWRKKWGWKKRRSKVKLKSWCCLSFD